MERRRNRLAILLQILAAVLSCVTTALPASAHRAPAPTVVAATASVRAVAHRARSVEERRVAGAHDAAPPAILADTTPIVAAASFERVAIAELVSAAATRPSIDHPTARGPPR